MRRRPSFWSVVFGTAFSAGSLLTAGYVIADDDAPVSPSSVASAEPDGGQPSDETDAPLPESSRLQPVAAQAQPTPPEPAPPSSQPPAPSTLPPTVVEAAPEPAPAEPQADAPPAEPTFGAFTSPPIDGYSAGSTTTGLKIDAPIIDVPGSIQVISPELMNDQGARTLDDIVRNVPGLVLQTNGGNRQEIYILRGFNILQSQFRKDGLRDVARTARDVSNIERVEILRGPASVLYGSGSPAGTINLITKSPLDYNYNSVQYMGGSYGFNRAEIDSTGPIDENGEFLYRLNLAGQISDSFRDFVFADRAFVAPAFTWVLDECSRLTIKGEYLYDDRMMDRGILAENGGFGTIPISRFFGEPTDVNRFREGQVSVFFDRQLTDIWSFHAGWISDYAEEVRKNADSRALVGTTLRRAYVIQDPTVEQAHLFTGDLAGDLEIGPWNHKLLFGSELGYYDFSNVSGSAGGTAGVPYGISINNPVYGQTPPAVTTTASYNRTEVYAMYAQDLIELNERWKVLISGRWEDSVRYTRNTTTQQNFDDIALTGRYGVVYQPVPERLSLYATYGESFTPLNSLTFNNEPFVPETGQLWETGIKFDMTDDLSLTLAGFDVFRQNAAVADPINPGFSVQTGEVESKGFEALLMGYLTDNWTIAANCAYIDARITQDTNTANIGLRPVSTPYYTESIWTRYNILQSEARTVGFGLGYLRVNNRLAQSTPVGAFHLPDYDRWDLAFYYDLPRWQFALNIENVLDADYYVGSQNATNVTPGAPITALGTIRYSY